MMAFANKGYRDDVLMREISPLQVAAYLRANGWREVHQNDRIAIWTLLPVDAEPDDYYEVLLPLHPDFRDFVPRMAELFCTLEQAEQRDRNEILDSLAIIQSDLVALRVVGDKVSNGNVPFFEAVRLIQHAYDLLQAVACSTASPRAVYSNRQPDRVRHYLDSLRVAPTRRGSYVVTIQSPVAPQFDTTDADQAEEPFERRVLRRLFISLQAVREAAAMAASHNSAEPFEKEVMNVVSANLCEAVADLAIGGKAHRLLWHCRTQRASLPAHLTTRLSN
jgi:hypothetical protein